MKKRLFKIPCLEAIASLARKYADNDIELARAFMDLDLYTEESKIEYKEALASRGINCEYCDKRFLPFPDDYGCCSIGCRYNLGLKWDVRKL